MRLGAPDASGRRAPEHDPGGDHRIDADMVIKALGFDAEDAGDIDDGAGRTRNSPGGNRRASVAPTPNSMGSPLASTQTGVPRRSGSGNGSQDASRGCHP